MRLSVAARRLASAFVARVIAPVLVMAARYRVLRSPAAPPPARADAKLVSIQYLRAIAATGVVACHASTSLFNRQGGLIPLEFGAYGVDLFFVISGFIMFHATLGGRLSPGDFILRRLIRIVPLYFLLTTVTYALALAFPTSFATASSDFKFYLASVLFIPRDNPVMHTVQPLLPQGWTLNYEMFFYVLFAAGLMFRARLRLVLVTAALATAAASSYFYAGRSPLLLTITNPLVLEFCFGMWVCLALSRGKLPGWPALVCVAAGSVLIAAFLAALYASGDGWRVLFAGVPGALVVTAALRLEAAGRLAFRPIFYVIGEASYSLYLGHTFVLAALRRLWQHFFAIDTLASHGAFIVVAIAASMIFAIALFVLVERPITVRLNRAARQIKDSWTTAARAGATEGA